jgi:hypothetical protein
MPTHSALATQLGVSKATLGAIKKKMSPGVHYAEQRPQLYTDAGVAFATAEIEPKKNAPLVITAIKGRFLFCGEIRVEIPISHRSLFHIGMTIPPDRYALSEIPNYARFTGRKPRRKGVW